MYFIQLFALFILFARGRSIIYSLCGVLRSRIMMRTQISSRLFFRFAIEKKLFVYDSGVRDGTMDYHVPKLHSGVRATIFGASGNIGRPIAAQLGLVNSALIMPLTLDHNFRHSEQLKELRTCGPTHRTWLDYSMNYKDQHQIEKMVENSNVVINLLGPRHKIKKIQDFEFINIEIPERIAQACAKKGVHRLIHFSAAGAQAHSPSLDFRTKHQGESVVRKAFPNATIFRPCPIYGLNDNFASHVRGQLNFFWNKFIPVYDDCLTKKQPIRDKDIAFAVLNALKLQQSKGKTYELGGPHVLTMLQVYQIIVNMMKIRPSLAYINPDLCHLILKHIYNWPYFSQELLRKRTIEEVVKEDRYLTIQDLLIEPVTFKSGVYQVLREYIAYYREIDEDYDN